MLSEQKKQSILQQLKGILNKYAPRHWMINVVGPWSHLGSSVPNCIALTLDGSPYWKFRFVNDSLQLVWQREARQTAWISPMPFSIPTGRFVSLDQFDSAMHDFMLPVNQRMSEGVAGYMKPSSRPIKVKRNCRGFAYGEFEDTNRKSCSIQLSSAIGDEAAIWLGCNDIGLVVGMPWRNISEEEISKAFGGTKTPCGWPEGSQQALNVIANTRMHLSQSQVKKLLPLLTKFAETGDLL